MTEVIQADLQQAQMLPSQHLLDTGYVNADVLASSQQRFGIAVINPTHPDVRMAGHYGSGNRCQSVCHRLATQAGDMPTRADECELDLHI